MDVIGRGLFDVLSHCYKEAMCKASPVLFVSSDKRVSKKGFVWQTVPV